MDLLTAIKLALITLILLGSLYSLITYALRIRASAKALSALRTRMPPIRRLTAQERGALTPLLVDPKSQKPLPLKDNQVYALEGSYSRHGLEGSGHASWHDTIGEVEVVLPFDSALHVMAHNHAEVVFAGRSAYVLSLNGTFTLLEGQAREQHQSKQNDAWEAGRRGAITAMTAEQTSPTDTAEAVRILSQRLETRAEVEHREGRGIGFVSALCWLLGFVALGVATLEGLQTARYIGLAVALAFMALGVRSFWRSWLPPAAQKINRVAGPLHLYGFKNPEQPGTVKAQLMLGDKLAFTVPEHWFQALTLKVDEQVEAELRVDDYSAVRLGPKMSLEQEAVQFPLVYWGRHLTLVLVGVGALLYALAQSPGVQGDLALTRAFITGAVPETYTTPETLLAAWPQAGTLVDLQGEGRCQVVPGNTGHDTARVDCQQLRWGGALPVAENTTVEAHTQTLLGGGFIQTRRDHNLERLLLLRGGGQGANRPLVVTNLKEVVTLVDAGCGTPDPQLATSMYISAAGRNNTAYECQRMRNTLRENLHFPYDLQFATWAALQTHLAETPDNEAPLEAVIVQGQLERVYRLSTRLGQAQLILRQDALAQDIMASQHGGVLLKTTGADGSRPSLSHGRGSVIEDWQRMLALTTVEGAQPFHLNGLITERGKDDAGTPYVVIDLTRDLADPGPATLRALWMLLATMLLLIHGPLLLRNALAQKARTQALQQRYTDSGS